MQWAQFRRMIAAVYGGPAHALRTAQKMESTLDKFEQVTHPRRIADLTTERIAAYVAARAAQVGANTIRGDLSYLSAAASLAVEEGWLERPPRFKRVRPRPARVRPPRLHTPEEIGRVLELLRARATTWEGDRLYALAALVAYTGLRRDEALTLMVDDVGLSTGLLAVSDRQRRKTVGSASTVPMPPGLVTILREWIPQCGSAWLFPGVRRRGPWTGGTCGVRACDRLRQAGETAGVPGLTLSSLRHSFATWARRRWGMSELELRDILRHTSPATQRWYVHDEPDPKERVRVVSRVSYHQ